MARPPAGGQGGGPVRRHELSVSTQHACILMLFAGGGWGGTGSGGDASASGSGAAPAAAASQPPRDRLSYREIADATGIPGPELKRALQSLALVKGKNVLRKEPVGKIGHQEGGGAALALAKRWSRRAGNRSIT
jgi:hypothetical protein